MYRLDKRITVVESLNKLIPKNEKYYWDDDLNSDELKLRNAFYELFKEESSKGECKQYSRRLFTELVMKTKFDIHKNIFIIPHYAFVNGYPCNLIRLIREAFKSSDYYNETLIEYLYIHDEFDPNTIFHPLIATCDANGLKMLMKNKRLDLNLVSNVLISNPNKEDKSNTFINKPMSPIEHAKYRIAEYKNHQYESINNLLLIELNNARIILCMLQDL